MLDSIHDDEIAEISLKGGKWRPRSTELDPRPFKDDRKGPQGPRGPMAVTVFGILSDRQQEILGWMLEFLNEHGYPPTVREIGDQFGITSPNGVMCHIRSLESKGYIRRDSYVARGITFLTRPNSVAKLEGDRIMVGPVALTMDQAAAVSCALRSLRKIPVLRSAPGA